MKQALLFIAGLVMSVMFAGFAITALGLTVMLVVDLVELRGDSDAFVGRIDHYIGREVDHPVLTYAGILIVAWLGTVGSAKAVDALGKRFRSPKI